VNSGHTGSKRTKPGIQSQTHQCRHRPCEVIVVRLSKFLPGTLALVLGTAALVVSPLAAAPAQALSSGVAFSADSLPTWQTNGVVWALQGAGNKVFAGGTFSQLRPPSGGSGTAIAVTGLVQLDAATGNPTTCRPALAGGSVTVRALTLSPDGKTLYVGGFFGSVAGRAANKVAAIDVATCTVRTTFNAPSISATVRALAATNDRLYLGGDFQSIAGQSRQYFAALDATTGALESWRADADTVGRAVAVSSDASTVLLGGDFFTVNGANSHSLAAVDAATGAVTRAYPRGFIPDTSVTKAITAGSSAFYVGNEGTGGGVFDGKLALPFATMNQLWRDDCLGATQTVLEVEGALYSGHHAHDCSSEGLFSDGERFHLTAQALDSVDYFGWFPDTNDGIGESIGPRALTVAHTAAQDYLWVGGEFTTTNGSAAQGLTRFGQSDTNAPPTPTVTVEATQAGALHVRWRSVVDTDDDELTYEVFRNGAATPIHTATITSVPWTRPQGSFVDTSVTPGQSYSYRVRVTDGTNVSALSGTASATVRSADLAYAGAVLADEPSLYWRFDEASGGVAWDSAGKGRNAVLLGTPAFRSTTGAADGGYAMGFTGAPVAASDWIENGPTTYSVETWFRTTTTTGGKLVGFGSGQSDRMSPPRLRESGSYDRHIYMMDSGRLVFGAYTGSTVTVTSPKAYNDGEWHQVVATQGSGGMTLYVDGARVGRNSNAAAQSYSGSWKVGGDNINGWPSRPSSNFFTGDIDDTSVYSSALSIQRVQAHYEATGRTVVGPPAPSDAYGKAVFDLQPELYWRLSETSGTTAADAGPYGTTGRYFGTRNQGVTGTVAGSDGRALAVTQGGVASDITFTNPENYSLEAWFTTTTTSGGKIIGFGDNQTGLSSNYDRHVYLQDDGRLVFGVWTGQANVITTPTAYNNGAWHHVVATQSTTGGMRLYVDGVLVGTNPQTASQSYTGYWKIGGDTTWGSSSPYLNGRLDEVAVYGGVLTATQVAQHYALGTGATPPDANPPTAPAGLTATAGESSVALAWTAATDDVGVTGYAVHRSTDASFTPSAATKVADTTSTSWTDPAVAAGTYTYKVVALDAAGNASAASTGATVTVLGPDTTAPGAPSGLTATVSGSDVALTWAAATDDRGVTGYQVHRSDDPDFTPSAATKIGDVTARSFTDADVADGTYTYKVVALDAAGNVGAASAGVTVTLPLPDTTAPTTPGGVTATASGDDVTVSWSASSDAAGVTGYVVHRSTNAAFTPSAATQVGTAAGTSFLDTGLADGTYTYKVVARDAAGNTSAASSGATVVVGAPPEPVTITLTPSEDTWVNQGAPTTVQGTFNQLSARGGTTLQVSYLKFALPSAPAGTVLSDASLRLRTTTATSAGSVDAYQLQWAASSSWSEASMVYASRPALSGTVVGTWAGGSAPSTTYQVPLTPAVVTARLGSTQTLALTSASADNVWLWSKEHTTATYRPQLTLTFEAP
jgi:large repetitive protein